MWNIEKQMSQIYKPLPLEKMIIGEKYLLIKNNFKIFGAFEGSYGSEKWISKNYALINITICDVSPLGFKIFSLKDIRTRQAEMYFRDISPYEVNIIIGKKWAEL